jgi:hypothetical protein
MDKENFSDKEAYEANMKLSKIMKVDAHIPHGVGEGQENSVTEANLKIQEAFYNENDQDDVLPTYMTNETAAIKITGNNK